MEVSQALQFVHCPLCGADEYDHLSSFTPFRVVRCRHCSLTYLNPRPSDAVISGLYDTEYFTSGPTYNDYVATHRKYAPIFARLYTKRLANMRRFVPPGGKVLEIGSAYGFWLKYLANHGYEVEGVEIAVDAAEFARSKLGLTVHNSTLISAALPDKTYDCVFMLDVLEHLPHPEQELAEVRRILAPGGVLYIQCPYELFHWEKVLEAWQTGKRTGTIRPDALPAHLMFFTPPTLAALLRREGFRILSHPAGNYGEIRRRMFPPAIKTAKWYWTLFNQLYYGSRLDRMARDAAQMLGQGSGIIYIARTGQHG